MGRPSGPHESGAAAGGLVVSPCCPRYACVVPDGAALAGDLGVPSLGGVARRRRALLLQQRGTRALTRDREPPPPQPPLSGPATDRLPGLPTAEPRFAPAARPGYAFDYDLRSDETTR